MWIWAVVAGVGLAALVVGLVLYDRAGKRHCPHCRALIPKSATTCPHCTGTLEEYLEERRSKSK